jgi:hypothetical protein
MLALSYQLCTAADVGSAYCCIAAVLSTAVTSAVASAAVAYAAENVDARATLTLPVGPAAIASAAAANGMGLVSTS